MPLTKKARYLRWYHLYYILAVFGLATIMFSLLLTQFITQKYNSSIEVNRQWSKRLKDLSELSRLTADVNSPGNDVFANHNVVLEKQLLKKSLVALESKLDEFKSEFRTAGLLNPVNYPQLPYDMLRLEKRLGELSKEATKTVNLFEQNKTDEAVRQMAYMDRRYFCTNAAFRTLALHISDIQKNRFENQSREIEFLRMLERLVAGAVVLMILGVTAYGHKLAKQMTRDESEKEFHLMQLQNANDGLKTKTDELQATLADLQTAQNQIVESERKFQAIFDHSFQFIGLTSPAGVLLEANRTALDFIGASREEVVGLPFWETPWWTNSTDMQERLKDAVRFAAEGNFVRFETSHVSKSGSVLEVDFSLKPVFDHRGEVVLLIPEGRDITEKKHAEVRVSEFYSTVSHELRTPLTSIRGSLGLIGGGLAGPITEKTQTLVTIACEESDRLIRLINDILDLRKIEAGMLELRISTVCPNELVEKVVKNLGGLAAHAGINLVAEDCRDIQSLDCDSDRIMQVLTNIVSNAIKFSSNGQDVSIKVGGNEQSVKFAVMDNGPGIPPEQRHKLFGKFQQIDQSDRRNKDGTGLGLAISKALIEQHGGRIDFDCGAKGGTTFWFELPRKQSVTLC